MTIDTAPRPITRRRRGLPANSYTSQAAHERELDEVFARSWIMVGHVSQASHRGQMLTSAVGDEQVVITHDGRARHAFYNVCQHRGHRLVDCGDEAHQSLSGVQSITCGYHAWVYGLDGRLMHARGEQVGDLRAPSVRVEELAGFLFVNLDKGARPLREVASGVEAELLAHAPDAANQVLAHRRSHLVEANWKVAVENYNECYHCPNVHKAFTRSVVSPGSYRITCEGAVIRHSADCATADRPAAEGLYAGVKDSYAAFFVWPVTAIQSYPGGVLNTFRWVPTGAERTLLVREWWLDSPSPTPEQMAKIDFDWDYTVSEDFNIMRSVQQGMKSRGYRPGPLITTADGVASTHSEDAVPHLHDLLRESLGQTAPLR